MNRVTAQLALLSMLSACASSTPAAMNEAENTQEDSGSAPDSSATLDADVGADTGAEAGADAAEPFECIPGLGDAGAHDPGFGRAFSAAKAACDARIRWACGDIMVTLGADGCVESTTSGPLAVSAGQPWLDCLLEELAATCDRCEPLVTRRYYESCTIL